MLALNASDLNSSIWKVSYLLLDVQNACLYLLIHPIAKNLKTERVQKMSLYHSL